jgi:hypothetical protein
MKTLTTNELLSVSGGQSTARYVRPPPINGIPDSRRDSNNPFIDPPRGGSGGGSPGGEPGPYYFFWAGIIFTLGLEVGKELWKLDFSSPSDPDPIRSPEENNVSASRMLGGSSLSTEIQGAAGLMIDEFRRSRLPLLQYEA